MGAAVTDWPKTGFRSNRMPARRRKRVMSRRAMRDVDMAKLLGLVQYEGRVGLLPVACVIEVT